MLSPIPMVLELELTLQYSEFWNDFTLRLQVIIPQIRFLELNYYSDAILEGNKHL